MPKLVRPGRITLKDAWLEVFPELEDWVADRRAEGVGAIRLRRLLYVNFGITIAIGVAESWLKAAGPPIPRKRKPTPSEPLLPRPRKPRPGAFDPDDPTDPRHGKVIGYTKHKCKCDRCKAAWAKYHREYSRRRPHPNYRRERNEAVQIATVLAARLTQLDPESAALTVWEERTWA